MDVNEKYAFEKKWGKNTSLIGWTAFPIALVFLQDELDISPVEFNVLVNLLVHWWDVDQHPFPAQTAMAHRMGMSKRSIQRALETLEEKKLLKKVPTSRTNPKYKGRNLYDLSLLSRAIEQRAETLRTNLKVKRGVGRKSDATE